MNIEVPSSGKLTTLLPPPSALQLLVTDTVLAVAGGHGLSAQPMDSAPRPQVVQPPVNK